MKTVAQAIEEIEELDLQIQAVEKDLQAVKDRKKFLVEQVGDTLGLVGIDERSLSGRVFFTAKGARYEFAWGNCWQKIQKVIPDPDLTNTKLAHHPAEEPKPKRRKQREAKQEADD